MSSINPALQQTNSDVTASHVGAAFELAIPKRKRLEVNQTVTVDHKKPRKNVGLPASTKTYTILKMLKTAKGVTLETLMEATGWQAHSVRGFLSGTVKKKLGHSLVSETGKDGVRRYRISVTTKAD